MPSMNNTQTIALQMEKVRDKVPLLYERDDILLTMIQARGDVEKVSSRNMRLPLQINPGGKGGMYNPNGGDLGQGSGTVYDFAQVSPVYFRFATQINKLVEYATDNKEKAIENAVKKEVANSMAQCRMFLDTTLQTAGNCVIGTISSVSGTVYTMSVPYGAALVYIGQTIQIWNSTLTTYVGAATVVESDPVSSTQTITVDIDPGAVGTNVITFDTGSTAANPVGTYGIPYQQSNATTGTWLTLNRGTYPTQVATPSVNAASSALVPSFVRLAINKMRKSLGVKGTSSKLIAHMNVEQSHAWENLGVIISSVIKEGAGGRANDLDLLFTGKMTMSGVPIKEDIHADQTRIDFLDLSHWGRAVGKDLGFYEVDGKTIFQVYGNSGGLAASQLWYYDTGFQVWTDSPRSGAYIYTLARPAGY